MALLLAVKLVLVFGVVAIGPVTPVCRDGVPCDKPAVHATLTFVRGAHVSSATTDAFGRYRLKLAPGVYVVHASVGMSMRPSTVSIRRSSTKLDFLIDTGIR